MIRKESSKRSWSVVILWLAVVCWAFPVGAQQIGNWAGYFPYLGEIYYFDHPLVVPQDGSITLTTTADSTFLNQFSSTRVLDGSGNTIDYSILLASPNQWTIPLTAGSYTVRIGRGLTDKYGNYTITANLTPASPGATEIENNDILANATTNPDNLFAGAIGYIRAKDVKDLSDYYCFILTGDTNVHFDLAAAGTLLDFDTTVTLRNSSDTGLNALYLTAATMTWDLRLAAGVYYLRLFTHDFARYGGYSITTTTTPAVAESSEIEVNDTIGAANPLISKTLYGSIGYMRNDATYDTYDYFSCKVVQGGTLSLEILSPATLHNFNNGVSIRNASNVELGLAYLSGSPRTVTVTDLAAGTYYIRVSRAVGYGAYQINVSGNVILPKPGVVGNIIEPLLLSE